jgi:hypothetical protein
MCQVYSYHLYDYFDEAFVTLAEEVKGLLRAFKPSLDEIEAVLAPEHFFTGEK